MTDTKGAELKKALRAAFPNTIPVLTGFLVLGVAFGMLMKANGYGALWSAAMSLIAYCGSMQFLTVSLLATGFDPVQAFLLSLMVNARHLFYGVSMLEKYRGMGKARLFLIYSLCDETFSIVSSVDPHDGVDKKLFYLCVSALDYIYWAAGSLAGGLFGELISFNTAGLDFALTALFVILFLEQMRESSHRPYGLLGLGAAAVSLSVFGAQGMVIPAMLSVLAVLLVGGAKKCA